MRLRQPDNDKWTLLTTHLSKNMNILANTHVWYYSGTNDLWHTCYKTLSRFWSVKRMPYVIHMGRNHGQTKELLIALAKHRPSRPVWIPKPCTEQLFSSLWARESEVNNDRWKCPHHYNSDPRPVDCKRSISNFLLFLEVIVGVE